MIKAMLARFTRNVLVDDVRSYDVAVETAKRRLRIEQANLDAARRRLVEFDRRTDSPVTR